MQLHQLKTNPIIKAFIYLAFWLIIFSFIFFYGWNAQSTNANEQQASFAQFQTDESFSFLPGRGIEYIDQTEVERGQWLMGQEKLQLLTPQLAEMLAGQMDPRNLVTIEEAVQKAVDIEILNMEADRLGIKVTNEEIDDFLRDTFKNAETLQFVMNQRGFETVPEFREQLRTEQRAARVQQYIASQARAPLYDLWQEYLNENEELRLKMAAFPVSSYEDQVELSEEELETFLADNIEDYRVPAKRRYQYVKVSEEGIREELEPTDEELRSFFDAHADEFVREETVEIEDIYAPITVDQSTTFTAQLMSELEDRSTTDSWQGLVDNYRSDNPGVNVFYREIGEVQVNDQSRRIYGPALIDRAIALDVDEISTPVQGNSGMHLVRKLGYTPSGPAPFEDVREEVKERYIAETATEKFAEIRDEMKTEIERFVSVRDLSSTLGYEDAITTLTIADSADIPEIGNLGPHAAYVRNLKPDVMSELILLPTTEPNMLVVMQIVQEEASYLPELDEVREEIETALKQEKALDLAKAAADAAMEKVSAGADFDEVAETAPEVPQESEMVTRVTAPTQLPYAMSNFQQEALKMHEDSVGVSTYGQFGDNPEGYVFWKVIATQEPTREDFRAERRQFERGILMLKGQTLVEEWLADQRKAIGYQIYGM